MVQRVRGSVNFRLPLLDESPPPPAGLVTTFFASVLGWMLYPLDCAEAADQSFSALMHGLLFRALSL